MLNEPTVEAFTRTLTGRSRLTKEVVQVIQSSELIISIFHNLWQTTSMSSCCVFVLVISTGGFKSVSRFLYVSFVASKILFILKFQTNRSDLCDVHDWIISASYIHKDESQREHEVWQKGQRDCVVE